MTAGPNNAFNRRGNTAKAIAPAQYKPTSVAVLGGAKTPIMSGSQANDQLRCPDTCPASQSATNTMAKENAANINPLASAGDIVPARTRPKIKDRKSTRLNSSHVASSYA